MNRTKRTLKTSLIIILIVSVPVIAFHNSCSSTGSVNLLTEGTDLGISSSDTHLVAIFNWAKKTSDGFTGSDNDPVGPWYEAALPGREAFCIRDVSHQCIAAEILGHSKQNLNMLRKFVENISEAKDYCTFWEINRYDKPAPVDYRNDDDFWYNLNANFDIIDACYKLYRWTGDTTYISDPGFEKFFQLTLNQYVERWQLQPDRIMERPALMNLKADTKKYKFARGIPSYDESQDGLTVSGDLLGMIFNGFRTYAYMLGRKGLQELSYKYLDIAYEYKTLIDSLWWDDQEGAYHGFYKTDKKFYAGGTGQSEFLLWYNVINHPVRIRRSLDELKNSQVEVLSYLPVIFYRYGRNGEAYDFLDKIYKDNRRDYPEASCGAIEGIVRGMAGVEPSSYDNTVTTCPKLTEKTAWVEIENIPLFSGLISVRHESYTKTIFANKSDKEIIWRAMFQGSFEMIKVNDKKYAAEHYTDDLGKIYTYLDISAGARNQVVSEAVGGR